MSQSSPGGFSGDPRPKKDAAKPVFDRSPPFDSEAERGVLGSILINPYSCDDVMLVIKSQDFYLESHALLFEHMVALHEAGKAVDPTLLVDRLKTAGKLDAVGGIAYLAELQLAVPTAANAKYYAEIVRQKAIYRALIIAGTRIVGNAYEQEVEADELLSQSEQEMFAILELRGGDEQQSLTDILKQVMVRIDARMSGAHVEGSTETGFSDFDTMTGGLHPGELIILAARPSMGKTALALNIAEYVSIDLGKTVLFVSLEMSALELGDRLLCSRAEVNGQKLRNGLINNDERKKLFNKASEVSQAPLVVDDAPSRRVSEIAAVARRLRRKNDLALIVIDYLQLIEPDNSKDPRQEQVAKIARRLKHMARELKTPVLCLAQLNRQTEASKDNIPRLSHLRESGAIEQDADVVMFVHREEYYAVNEEDKERLRGKAQVIVAKQRNGPTGEVDLVWRHMYTRFANASPHEHDEFRPHDDF